MKKASGVMLRLPPATVERIDHIVAQVQAEKRGLPVTRAGVCYMLLESALAAWYASRPAPPPSDPSSR